MIQMQRGLGAAGTLVRPLSQNGRPRSRRSQEGRPCRRSADWLAFLTFAAAVLEGAPGGSGSCRTSLLCFESSLSAHFEISRWNGTPGDVFRRGMGLLVLLERHAASPYLMRVWRCREPFCVPPLETLLSLVDDPDSLSAFSRAAESRCNHLRDAVLSDARCRCPPSTADKEQASSTRNRPACD